MGTGLWERALPAKGKLCLPAGYQRPVEAPLSSGLWDPAGSFAPFRGLMTTLAISGRRGLPLAKRMLV